jgi:lipopolysaccharide assembly outer membrane protein LptD (OstA)
MKLHPLLISAILLSIPAQAQTAKAPPQHVEFVAARLTRAGTTLRGAGAVQAKAAGLILNSDEGTYNTETGEVDLRGHVRVTLPARTDHHLFRYDKESIVTEQSVDLSADRIDIKNHRLLGSGHVLVRLTGAQLRGDELELYLSTGDAQLRGNVQAVRQGKRGGRPEFPPEIIK